jgi:hypothetical protein
MRNLAKTGLIIAATIAFASCQKTEFNSVVPSEPAQQSNKSYHVESIDDLNGNLLADRDKCKKCHTAAGKTMGIDWTAPYMSDGRYNSIEELIDNYDFVNDIHLMSGTAKADQSTISDEQKNELISYLKNL